MSDDLLARARSWLELDPDPETRAELSALVDAGDTKALEDRFSGTLEFGTAGIRGVLGAGPMRMNRVVVRKVSAGVASYYDGEVVHAHKRGVVIGYDGRKNSRVFAEDAAGVYLASGYHVYLATHPVPTPLCAFAVKDLGAAIGVMVTASHNPPEYNGYKVYAPNGAQIIPPQDTGIAAEIEKIELPVVDDLDTRRESGHLEDLGLDVEERYLGGVHSLEIHPDAAEKAKIVIAYTPLHGVGADLAEKALAQAGFEAVHTVAAQREPDPDFPTVRFPNPEEKGAMDLVLALAEDNGADIACANDPDADRLAVALPGPDGWKMLTGDQVGALLADYILSEGEGGAERSVACSLVSSQLLSHMAEKHGVHYLETLTGFKWIANTAMAHTERFGSRFVFGYEEALGYTVGELVRDKDGIGAVTLFAEMTAWAKARGETVHDRLEAIYRRHGVFLTEQRSLVLPGAAGLDEMRALMARFRDAPPSEIGGHPVARFEDLAKGGELPPSDVLVFRLEGGARVIMRPSGTEPKLKSYYEVREPVSEEEPLDAALSRARKALDALAEAHQRMMK